MRSLLMTKKRLDGNISMGMSLGFRSTIQFLQLVLVLVLSYLHCKYICQNHLAKNSHI